MLQIFDPITQQLLQSLINQVNRSTGILDGARLLISSQFAGSYVYASPAARRLCHDTLRPLMDSGLIDCAWHLEVLADFETLKQIEVPSGHAFLRYLQVTPQANMVADASATLRELKCGIEWIDQKIKEIGERWRVGARYLQLGPEHITQVAIAAKLAKRIASERIAGRSIRALSLDWFGATHTIDEHRQVICQFCEAMVHPLAKDLDHTDQLASLGLVHHSSLLHLRGPLEAICDDDKLIDVGGWSGTALCPEFIRGFERNAIPRYILTIEDPTLYQRYLAAIDDGGLVVFVGDFPSATLLSHFEKIVDMLPPDVPLYHWGDIDLAGFKTAQALQDALFARVITPYNMGRAALLDLNGDNPSLGAPISLSKLRKLAFSCDKALREALVEISTLPEEKIRELNSEDMSVISPLQNR